MEGCYYPVARVEEGIVPLEGSGTSSALVSEPCKRVNGALSLTETLLCTQVAPQPNTLMIDSTVSQTATRGMGATRARSQLLERTLYGDQIDLLCMNQS